MSFSSPVLTDLLLTSEPIPNIISYIPEKKRRSSEGERRFGVSGKLSGSPVFARGVDLLNLGGLHDFLEVSLNLLVGERVAKNGLLAFEGGEELGLALRFELHDVEAELRANRGLSDFTGLERRESRTEGGNEGAGNDPTEEPPLSLVAGVFGEFGGKLAEVRTLVDAGDEVLRLVFRLHEDVTNLVFGVAVSSLFTVVGGLEVGFGDGVLLGPVLSEGRHQDLLTGVFNGLLDGFLIFNLGLLGFLEEHLLLNEDVLHLAFELVARGLALSDRAIVEHFLFGNGYGFAVHLEGLEFGAGRAGGDESRKTEGDDFLVHF